MKIHITLFLSEQTRTFEFQGRLGWAMAQLAMAGAKGVATVERPAPRWSGYVHDLRKRGIQIETEMEEHQGSYPGRHARYRLSCDTRLRVLSKGGKQ
ncbi:MAG: winged helix domain-containing protein [Cognatishimia sp.]